MSPRCDSFSSKLTRVFTLGRLQCSNQRNEVQLTDKIASHFILRLTLYQKPQGRTVRQYQPGEVPGEADTKCEKIPQENSGEYISRLR